MNRIRNHIPALLGLRPATSLCLATRLPFQQHSTRYFAKKASPFKYSHPDSKSKNATFSPSSLTTSAAATTAAKTATVGARETASRKATTAGSGGNFSRQLADMCAKQDVVMYTPPENLKKTFWLAYATAGLQLVFWVNTAQYAFTHYTDNPMFSLPTTTATTTTTTTTDISSSLPSITSETPGTLPGTEGVVQPVDTPLAPLRTRIIISAGLVGTGLVIAFGICAIPW
ncbi:hypothetical protein BG004_003671, partial [Podila humilis]